MMKTTKVSVNILHIFAKLMEQKETFHIIHSVLTYLFNRRSYHEVLSPTVPVLPGQMAGRPFLTSRQGVQITYATVVVSFQRYSTVGVKWIILFPGANFSSITSTRVSGEISFLKYISVSDISFYLILFVLKSGLSFTRNFNIFTTLWFMVLIASLFYPFFPCYGLDTVTNCRRPITSDYWLSGKKINPLFIQ